MIETCLCRPCWTAATHWCATLGEQGWLRFPAYACAMFLCCIFCPHMCCSPAQHAEGRISASLHFAHGVLKNYTDCSASPKTWLFMQRECQYISHWSLPPTATACTLRPSCGCPVAAHLRSRCAAGQAGVGKLHCSWAAGLSQQRCWVVWAACVCIAAGQLPLLRQRSASAATGLRGV